jgi:hypothetical protein
MPQVFIETRKRGLFGKLARVIFWAWQIIMALWLASYLVILNDTSTNLASTAARTGYAIGGVIGTMLLFLVWISGTAIIGAIVLMTRGSRVITSQYLP